MTKEVRNFLHGPQIVSVRDAVRGNYHVTCWLIQYQRDQLQSVIVWQKKTIAHPHDIAFAQADGESSNISIAYVPQVDLKWRKGVAYKQRLKCQEKVTGQTSFEDADDRQIGLET